MKLYLPQLADHDFEVHVQLPPGYAPKPEYAPFEAQNINLHYVRYPENSRRRFWLWLIPKLMRYARLLPHLDLAWQLDRLLQHRIVVPHSLLTRQIVQQHGIKILHAHDSPWLYGAVSRAVARLDHLKYIHSIYAEVIPHQSELERFEESGQRFAPPVKQILSDADLILSITRHCSTSIEHVGLATDLVKIIPFTIDAARFYPQETAALVRRKFSVPDDTRLVLFQGQIRPRKGPQILLEAIPQVVRQVENVMFLFVGPDYNLAGQLTRQAQSLGVADHIVFTGPVPDDEIADYYNACDIFAFPSCTNIECFGLSAIQAMACAKPVVGFKVGGVPEVVIDGQTGLLSAKTDAAALAENLLALLQNPALAAQLGQNGRQRSLTEYSLDRIVNQHKQVYFDVLANGPQVIA